MKTPWLADDVVVPAGLDSERFRLRPLTIHDVIKDFDAVMSSRAELRDLFGPGTQWPADNLTIEQNLIDLAWHQKEFQTRGSFTYTVVSPDESRVLGCVYLFPPRDSSVDVIIYYWVRSSELAGGLEQQLLEQLHGWLAREWPFKCLSWPGRGPLGQTLNVHHAQV